MHRICKVMKEHIVLNPMLPLCLTYLCISTYTDQYICTVSQNVAHIIYTLTNYFSFFSLMSLIHFHVVFFFYPLMYCSPQSDLLIHGQSSNGKLDSLSLILYYRLPKSCMDTPALSKTLLAASTTDPLVYLIVSTSSSGNTLQYTLSVSFCQLNCAPEIDKVLYMIFDIFTNVL